MVGGMQVIWGEYFYWGQRHLQNFVKIHKLLQVSLMDILFCNTGYGLSLKVSPVILYWKAGKKAF